eukprot:4858646-Amphidinium_carterae.2
MSRRKAWSDVPKQTEHSNLSSLTFAPRSYLALTSLQLRYDVHVVRGGLHLTHSTDLSSMISFRVYSVIPFVEEFRVLIDWSAQLFMGHSVSRHRSCARAP